MSETRAGVKPLGILRYATVIGGGDKKPSHSGAEQMSPRSFFFFFGSETMVLFSASPDYKSSSERSGKEEGKGRESPTRKRPSESLRGSFGRSRSYGPGNFQASGFPEKIYGEVTAWIAMNSVHPPLSRLVIALNLLAPQVLRACVRERTFRRMFRGGIHASLTDLTGR